MTTADDLPAVRVGQVGDVAVVELNRPRKRNSLRAEDMVALAEAVEQAGRGGVARAVLLRAAGEHFCAGADLVTANEVGRPSIGAQMRGLPANANRAVKAVWDCPLPVVAAVRGGAVGFGCHLTLAADFVVASEESFFLEPFAKIGFSGDSAVTFLLPRVVGLPRAKEMLMRATRVTAADALAWGIVTRVVPNAELDVEADALAAELAAGPTFSLGLSKRQLHRHLNVGIDEALESEAAAVELTIRSEDFKQGIAAFASRTPAVFTGR